MGTRICPLEISISRECEACGLFYLVITLEMNEIVTTFIRFSDTKSQNSKIDGNYIQYLSFDLDGIYVVTMIPLLGGFVLYHLCWGMLGGK